MRSVRQASEIGSLPDLRPHLVGPLPDERDPVDVVLPGILMKAAARTQLARGTAILHLEPEPRSRRIIRRRNDDVAVGLTEYRESEYRHQHHDETAYAPDAKRHTRSL